MPVPSATPALPATPTPSPTPSTGTLRVVQAADPTTLDPWAARDEPTLLVLRQVFEPLVDLAPGTFRIVPKLADHWDVSSDGRTYTMTLRSGIRFHDGTAFDAAAVVANFERSPATERFELGARIASVRARDPSTVVFTLAAPYAPFLASIASPSFGIVSPVCFAQDPSWATAASRCAAGTGPFRIEAGAWQRGEEVTLVRNASYWARDASGASLPSLDAITFRAIADEASRAAAVHAGSADIAVDLGPAGAAQLRSDPNVAVTRRPSFDASFLGFGAGPGPLASADVRRAIAMAIDRTTLTQTVFAGDAKVASQLVPPGISGYDDTVIEFARYDPAAAKKLIADAGLVNPFSADLWYPSSGSPTLPDPKRVAESIAADLLKVGITVTLRPAGAARIASDARAGLLPLWLADRPAARADPDPFLADVTDDPVVNALLERARAEPDGSKRAELYKQVTKLIQQQTARLPLFNATEPLAASRRVRGLVAQPIVGESFAGISLGR